MNANHSYHTNHTKSNHRAAIMGVDLQAPCFKNKIFAQVISGFTLYCIGWGSGGRGTRHHSDIGILFTLDCMGSSSSRSSKPAGTYQYRNIEDICIYIVNTGMHMEISGENLRTLDNGDTFNEPSGMLANAVPYYANPQPACMDFSENVYNNYDNSRSSGKIRCCLP